MKKSWLLSTLLLGACGRVHNRPGMEAEQTSPIVAFTQSCSLKTPIDLSGSDFTRKKIVLHDVLFDRPLLVPGNHLGDPMLLQIFPIRDTSYVGARINVEKSRSMGLGFAEVYEGDFHLSGTTHSAGDLTVYSTREAFSSQYYRALDLAVRGNQLVALQIEVPTEKWTETAGWIWSGEIAKLCLESATVDSSGPVK